MSRRSTNPPAWQAQDTGPYTKNFVGDVPSKNLVLPNGLMEITAVEIIAYCPYWLKNGDVAKRLLMNGFEWPHIAEVLNFHCNTARGDISYNWVLKAVQPGMRKLTGNPKWTHNKNMLLMRRKGWSANDLTLAGCLLDAQYPAPRGLGRGIVQSYPFRMLGDHLKQRPQGDDALNLTRCVEYAIQHPEEDLEFPRDFQMLVQKLGPVLVTPQHLDAAAVTRWTPSQNPVQQPRSTNRALLAPMTQILAPASQQSQAETSSSSSPDPQDASIAHDLDADNSPGAEVAESDATPTHEGVSQQSPAGSTTSVALNFVERLPDELFPGDLDVAAAFVDSWLQPGSDYIQVANKTYSWLELLNDDFLWSDPAPSYLSPMGATTTASTLDPTATVAFRSPLGNSSGLSDNYLANTGNDSQGFPTAITHRSELSQTLYSDLDQSSLRSRESAEAYGLGSKRKLSTRHDPVLYSSTKRLKLDLLRSFADSNVENEWSVFNYNSKHDYEGNDALPSLCINPTLVHAQGSEPIMQDNHLHFSMSTVYVPMSRVSGDAATAMSEDSDNDGPILSEEALDYLYDTYFQEFLQT
ncbi:hypothetical protein E8E11_010735 [Didymella keratinophila]|nr:hypothetical protein E8E11_010735 [Didymella keratinophila]